MIWPAKMTMNAYILPFKYGNVSLFILGSVGIVALILWGLLSQLDLSSFPFQFLVPAAVILCKALIAYAWCRAVILNIHSLKIQESYEDDLRPLFTKEVRKFLLVFFLVGSSFYIATYFANLIFTYVFLLKYSCRLDLLFH